MPNQYVDAGQMPGQLQLAVQCRCRLQVRKWLPVDTGTRRRLLALRRYRLRDYGLPSQRVQLYADAGSAYKPTLLQPVDVPRRILRRLRLPLSTRFDIDYHTTPNIANKHRISFGI